MGSQFEKNAPSRHQMAGYGPDWKRVPEDDVDDILLQYPEECSKELVAKQLSTIENFDSRLFATMANKKCQ